MGTLLDGGDLLLASACALLTFALRLRLVFNVSDEGVSQECILLHDALIFLEELEGTVIAVVEELPDLVVLADVTA